MVAALKFEGFFLNPLRFLFCTLNPTGTYSSLCHSLTRTQSDTASPSFSRSLACLYPRSSRQTHAPATAHQCTTVHRRSGHHHQPHLFLSQSLSHYSASLSLSEGYWVGKFIEEALELLDSYMESCCAFSRVLGASLVFSWLVGAVVFLFGSLLVYLGLKQTVYVNVIVLCKCCLDNTILTF
ncbi:uncharacterized protein LOC130723694 [Lotus japonicus]|uniref:uncharacterized protein LOC130723694 n=1 Tax=Lotus japonicus TaxID=34305 RepID=UPI002587D9D4|nr:uncharacterized protein LOC130723694 [Lotus japonicus]